MVFERATYKIPNKPKRLIMGITVKTKGTEDFSSENFLSIKFIEKTISLYVQHFYVIYNKTSSNVRNFSGVKCVRCEFCHWGFGEDLSSVVHKVP
jgi:hypothetical protein